eukprot:UN18392
MTAKENENCTKLIACISIIKFFRSLSNKLSDFLRTAPFICINIVSVFIICRSLLLGDPSRSTWWRSGGRGIGLRS